MSVREQIRQINVALQEQARQQPLFAAVVFFLPGLIIGYKTGMWLIALGGVVVCGALLVYVRRVNVRLILLAVLMVLLGWSLAARDRDGREEEARRWTKLDARRSFVASIGSNITVSPRRNGSAFYKFSAQNVQCEDSTNVVCHLPFEVSWYRPKNLPEDVVPQPGEIWRLTGSAKVRRQRNGMLNLTVSTGVDRSKRLSIADPCAWQARIDHIRRQAIRRVTIGIEDWGVMPSLNQAMLVGYRSAMSKPMRRIFADSGTMHVFAISGMNIAFVAGLLVMVVRIFSIQRPYWIVLVAPLLIIYTVATGASPSAVRACMMGVFFGSAPLFGRRPSVVSAMAGTALIMHALQPELIFDIGNILSFVVMIGLVALCGPFCKIGHQVVRLEALERRALLFEAADQRRKAKWIRSGKNIIKFFVDLFAMSFAAWLASVPLTAYYFGRFTPGGLVANLIIVPCSFMIVMAGCFGLVTSFVSNWVASCFNHAAGFFIAVMVRTAEITADFPGANWLILEWDGWMVWAWFAALIIFAFWLRKRVPVDGLEWLTDKSTENK